MASPQWGWCSSVGGGEASFQDLLSFVLLRFLLFFSLFFPKSFLPFFASDLNREGVVCFDQVEGASAWSKMSRSGLFLLGCGLTGADLVSLGLCGLDLMDLTVLDSPARMVEGGEDGGFSFPCFCRVLYLVPLEAFALVLVSAELAATVFIFVVVWAPVSGRARGDAGEGEDPSFCEDVGWFAVSSRPRVRADKEIGMAFRRVPPLRNLIDPVAVISNLMFDCHCMAYEAHQIYVCLWGMVREVLFDCFVVNSVPCLCLIMQLDPVWSCSVSLCKRLYVVLPFMGF